MRQNQDNTEAFLNKLTAEDDCDRLNSVFNADYEVKAFVMNLDGLVGSASFEQDTSEPGYFNWEISLGPVNSQKLIDFLKTLKSEPGEDGE